MTNTTDESRAQSSTGPEACPICSGAACDDDGNPCPNCGGTGVRARPARVDPRPTIPPSTHVLCTVCATVVARKEARQIGARFCCRKCSGEEG